jgi:hypothetical protein
MKMKSLPLIAVCILASSLSVVVIAEDAVEQSKEIPLDQIWAYEMPGTLDVRELEPDRFGAKVRNLGSEEQIKRSKESLTFQIMKSMGVANRGVQVVPGFAVLGSGKEALRNAHTILVNGQKPRETFPANSKISLVFFSKVFGYYVHLDKVEREGTTITIKYFFVPHRETVTSTHFALIPLGELVAGEWQVDVARSPWPGSPKFSIHPEPAAEWDPIVVCRPFSFTIERHVVK